MISSEYHSFHIPVMGLGYTIDTPVKVAKFGIDSVLSIVNDNLLEQMREYYCGKEQIPYEPISESEPDPQARRITAYLNLMHRIVSKQLEILKKEPFEAGNDVYTYFNMLPDSSPLKVQFKNMLGESDNKKKLAMQEFLRGKIKPGSIDVNIMTKCDRLNYDKDGNALPAEFADAMSALRGFAKSTLTSSMVFSAGLNPRLFSYCETFPDFFPDENGSIPKKIILKVSDYRSANIQGKILAKKGLWVSEYRIESGLNCGGHAFATDGLLLGPILEEFKSRKKELTDELQALCNRALAEKGKPLIPASLHPKISVQGGIGTSTENKFLLHHYEVDATGWGSPFLLVPEATNVDDETLHSLAEAKPEDYFLSNASPLGLPFHNFRKSTAEKQRLERIAKGRPGSPCKKEYLGFDTEFTKTPICTGSRQYMHLKLKQLDEKKLTPEEYKIEFDKITEKDCLCEGLSASVFLKNDFMKKGQLKAVTICPGPNLKYFSGIYTLGEMIDHIYGRKNILNKIDRPSMFINELKLYVDHLKKEFDKSMDEISAQKLKYLNAFRANLLEGIEYYKDLFPRMKEETLRYCEKAKNSLASFVDAINELKLPAVAC